MPFVAKGRPALIAIKGTGDGATGSLNEMNGTITGEIQFQLKSLKTGIDLRDSHLKDKYLEVEKFPIATSDEETLQFPISQMNQMSSKEF